MDNKFVQMTHFVQQRVSSRILNILCYFFHDPGGGIAEAVALQGVAAPTFGGSQAIETVRRNFSDTWVWTMVSAR